MARITVEDCLVKERNRFALVLLAAKRTKQLLHGGKAVSEEHKGNKPVVMSLREIAEGKVRFMTEEDKQKMSDQTPNSGDSEPLQEVVATDGINDLGSPTLNG